MACKSKQNTISHLKQIGVLDEYGRVINTSRLEQLNTHYLNHATNNLGIATDGNLLSYREIKRQDGTSRSNTKSYYVLETNDTIFERIDEAMYRESDVAYSPTDIDYFENAYSAATAPIVPKYDKYIQYKENLLRRLNNRLSRIEVEKRLYSSDVNKLRELNKLQNQIEVRLKGMPDLQIPGLEGEILELKGAPAIDRMEFYIQADFDRLENLVESNSPADLQEARVMIRFYKALGEFDVSKGKDKHPIFNLEDIIGTDGKNALPEDLVVYLMGVKERAKVFGNQLAIREKEAILENVNTNTKVIDMFDRELSYDELFFKEKGLKDTPWMDMFLMDITNGIFSTNGIIPQVMMNNLQNSFEKHLVGAKDVENRMNELQPQVEQALKDLKRTHGLDYDLAGRAGIFGIKGVSYDLFQAQDANGNFKDSIVQRYDASYMEARGKMFHTHKADLAKAFAIEDPARRQVAIQSANIKRRNWYKKNTVVIDVNQINDPTYLAGLESILGAQGLAEELAKQEKLLRDYDSMLQIVKENAIAEGGTLAQQNKKVEAWVVRNSPYRTASDYYNNTVATIGAKTVYPSMKYTYSIPRKNKVNLVSTPDGLEIHQTNEETGFYDEKFKIIEGNSTLKKFHELIMEVQNSIIENMPAEVRSKLNANSLPALEKNLIEILSHPNMSYYAIISKAYRYIIDKILGSFGLKPQDPLSQANIDPITNKPEYQVNSEFLKSNKEEINQRYGVEILRLQQALGLPITTKIGKYTTHDLTTASPQALAILAEALNVEATLPAIQARLSAENMQNAEISKILRAAITDQVVKEKSFDLPKIMKLYSYMSAEYAARQEVLPLMEILKGHYEEIKDPAKTNLGAAITNRLTGETRMEGVRGSAVRQMDSWFNRAVLGNYGSVNEVGNTTLKRPVTLGLNASDKMNLFNKDLTTTITGKIMNTQEKILAEKIPGLVADLEAIINAPDITELEKDQAKASLKRLMIISNNLGKQFSATKMFDAIFNFIRLKGLGWNLSSSVTNFMEGQSANFIIAATGDHFTPENIYRANRIVRGSAVKNISFGAWATDEAKLTSVLMSRYRILQDASNELQKASSKSAFNKFQKLDPYELTRRTEFLNQAPIMISVLLDQKITGIDGTVSNVFDAMQPNGMLKDNFATDENKANWEQANGAEYNDLKSHITKTIVVAHGDYDQLRGNMGSERISGKALLMFKRWMARQFYQRFAMVEQPDLETGVKSYKGRYLSHTKGSGFVHGALVGFSGLGILGAGPLGLVIGGAAGFGMASFWGSNTGFSFLQEVAFTTKELLLSLLKMPINSLTGKNTVTGLGLDGVFAKAGIPSTYEGLNLNDRDTRNFKANMIEMSLTLGWMGLMLFTKALLWDDEDDTDDTRRKAHNLLANRFMQLAGQATMYSNPMAIKEATIDSIPVFQFIGDIGKLAQEAQDFVEGEDTLAGGSNAGESAFFNQLQKTFMPGIFKGGLGFESATKKQFRPHAFDAWFHSNDKKAKKITQGMRAAAVNEYLGEGMTKEEAKKATKKKYRYKKKGESYQDLLKHYKEVD